MLWCFGLRGLRGTISGRNVDDLVSLANGSTLTFSFSGLSSLVNNAQFKDGTPLVIAQ
jgi:hypothetical protein